MFIIVKKVQFGKTWVKLWQMKIGIYRILAIASIIYLLSMYFLGKNNNKKVLGLNEGTTATPEAKITPSITPTPTLTPTDTPSPKPMGSAPSTSSRLSSLTTSPSVQRTAAPVIPTATSAEVNGFIDRFSSQYGVDPNILRYIAICESGFSSNAKNGPYIGLFQFGEITWKNIRKEFGEDTNPDLRYSAEESVQTAAYALSHGKGKIWPNCQP